MCYLEGHRIHLWVCANELCTHQVSLVCSVKVEGRHKQKKVSTVALLTFANMLIKNRPVQRKKSWTESRLEFYDAKHEVPFIVTVVNDVPIKNLLKKWFSGLHHTRQKNQSQSNSAPANQEHQPKDAVSMFLSRQHFAETGVCGCEQKMS